VHWSIWPADSTPGQCVHSSHDEVHAASARRKVLRLRTSVAGNAPRDASPRLPSTCTDTETKLRAPIASSLLEGTEAVLTGCVSTEIPGVISRDGGTFELGVSLTVWRHDAEIISNCVTTPAHNSGQARTLANRRLRSGEKQASVEHPPNLLRDEAVGPSTSHQAVRADVSPSAIGSASSGSGQ
jgi:hypothetical protein